MLSFNVLVSHAVYDFYIIGAISYCKKALIRAVSLVVTRCYLPPTQHNYDDDDDDMMIMNVFLRGRPCEGGEFDISHCKHIITIVRRASYARVHTLASLMVR